MSVSRGPIGRGVSALLVVFSVAGVAASLCFAQARRAATAATDAATTVAIYRNGRIYTNDPAAPWAEAILVRGEEILAVGDDDEVAALADKGAQVVDLEKHFVMPGFNDAHVHIGGAGQDWIAVRLNGAQSIEELQKRLAAGVAEHKEGEWIVGSGWDHTFWPEKRFPNRQQLDVVSPKNPVILTHISGHVAVANSLALQLFGITKSTPNPTGGEIEKDAQGEPTGMLKGGEWIVGSGWDHTFWPEKRFPNRQQLDVVSPKNPVILTHISGHVAVANS